MAIKKVATQVRSLQLAQAGPYQKNTETLNYNAGHWTNQFPLMFCVNDFTPGSPIWETNIVGGLPSHNIATSWAKAVAPHGGPGLENYSYWVNSNDDTCSFLRYRPISTCIQFQFTADVPTMQQTWFRIDVIVPRKTLTTTAAHNLRLPNNGCSMAMLASDNMTNRNRINRQYFKIVGTKWVVLSNDTTATRHMMGDATFKYKFGSEVYNLDADHNLVTHVGATPQTFITNMPYNKQMFCVLSTSAASGVSCRMFRYISYRDQHGVAS